MIIEHEAFRTAVKLGIVILTGLYAVAVVLAMVVLRLTNPELFGATYSPPNDSVLTALLLVMLPFLAGSWFLPGFMSGWRYYRLHHMVAPNEEDIARLGALTGSVTSGLGYLLITLTVILLTLPLQSRWLGLLAERAEPVFSLPFFVDLNKVWFIPILMLSILVTMALWTGFGAAMGAAGALASWYHQKTGKFIRNPFRKSPKI